MSRRTAAFVALIIAAGAYSAIAEANHAHRGGITAAQHAAPAQTLSLTGAEAIVAFSPNGDITKVVVDAIDAAKKQVLVQAYGFSSAPIIRALGDAKARGVDVEAILDKSDRSPRYTGASYLANHNIPVWIDDSVAIAHNKVMIIDGDSVITGSFNFTKAAQEKNAENILYIEHAPALAKIYTKDWLWRKGLSRVYN